MEKKAKGFCYASFGELLQGVLSGNKSFLVNCPISRKSTVEVSVQPSDNQNKSVNNTEIVEPCFQKTDMILQSILSDHMKNSTYSFHIDSNIPVKKGLSSSTADMVAAIHCLEKILSKKLSSEYISKMLTKIEPNDGLHYPGISAYCHKEGSLIANVKDIPPLMILGIDLGGQLDTVAFNEKQLVFSDKEMKEYDTLLNKLLEALSHHDLTMIGKIATESAIRWQSIIYRNELETLIEIMHKTDALGVINTHSGTYVGLLFSPDSQKIKIAEQMLRDSYPDHLIEYFSTIGMDDYE